MESVRERISEIDKGQYNSSNIKKRKKKKDWKTLIQGHRCLRQYQNAQNTCFLVPEGEEQKKSICENIE